MKKVIYAKEDEPTVLLSDLDKFSWVGIHFLDDDVKAVVIPDNCFDKLFVVEPTAIHGPYDDVQNAIIELTDRIKGDEVFVFRSLGEMWDWFYKGL